MSNRTNICIVAYTRECINQLKSSINYRLDDMSILLLNNRTIRILSRNRQKEAEHVATGGKKRDQSQI